MSQQDFLYKNYVSDCDTKKGTKDEKQLKNDDPLKGTIGDFGFWQLKMSVMMSLLKLPIAWFTLSIVFLAPPTQFWCKPPPSVNITDEKWLRLSRPKDEFAWKQEGLNTGYCIMTDTENDPNTTIPCVYGYSYNTTIFHSTIVTEWNLVCGHQRFIDLSQITLMLGILIGNILFGIVADRKGRKTVLVICIILQSFLGIIASVVPWFSVFLIARFFLAIANGGTMVTSFVMCMEVVGDKWRTVVAILYQMPFGFGNSIMAIFAYFLRDWRIFHLALSLVASCYIFYIWCVPESPRWLIAVGRKDEAIEILKQAAKINKMDIEKVDVVFTDLSNTGREETKKASLGALFSTMQMRKRSILLILNWAICGITFYAFSQYLGNIGSNIFFTVATSGLIVLPGTLLCIYLVGKCGRRWTIALAHTIMGCCFLAILMIPKGMYNQDWPRVVLAAAGLIGLSVSLPAIYLFTGELYPTVLRNVGVGICVMFSRIGSMLSPLIISLEEIHTALPLLILASAAFIETILILPLPETKGATLPETVEDLETKHVKLYKISSVQAIRDSEGNESD